MFDPRPLLRLLPLAAGLLLANPAAAQPSTPAPSTAWPASKGRAPFHPPAEDQIPDNRFGRLVRYGEHVFVDTQILRGKYVGNGLQCVSCHLDRGRLANASPMWAAYVGYPKHLKKSGREITLTQRIQGCFRFSMNGSPPPANGRVIKALEAYFHWLATGAPKGVALKGAGYPPIAEPDRAPSIARGKQVYEADCALCHGAHGRGTKLDSRHYAFPPLWGPDAYNWGAGMHELNVAAGFVHANMPLGQPDTLSIQQAWDVAAYIDSHKRPQDPRFVGSVEETQMRYHQHDCLYGHKERGKVLGAHPYPDPLAQH